MLRRQSLDIEQIAKTLTSMKGGVSTGFNGLTLHEEAYTKATLCRVGKAVPPEIVRLVESCWEPSFDRRPSFKAIAKQLQALFDAMPPKKEKKCSIM